MSFREKREKKEKKELKKEEKAKILKRESLWRETFNRIKKNKVAMFGLGFIVFIFLFSFIGPLFSPYVDEKVQADMIKVAPSFQHWLGTDNLGRDVLTRLMLAGRISLTVGLASMTLSLIIGTTVGAVSGFYGGIVDTLLMRFADILMSIPSLPLLIILSAVLSGFNVPSEYRLYLVMIILSLVGWPGLARMVRGQVLSFKERSFMDAAEVLGLSDRRKIFNHLIPNIVPILIVVATLSVAGSILSESALSYLGLGVVPPTPSWGSMMDAANNIMDFQKRPWLWAPPGIAIFLTVVSINVLGDALRDALDPNERR